MITFGQTAAPLNDPKISKDKSERSELKMSPSAITVFQNTLKMSHFGFLLPT